MSWTQYKQRFSHPKPALSKRGFTIVELIVVIAVIGVLATITVIGFARYQTDGRDTQRVASISVISEALEKYYDAHGEYPSCPNVTAAIATVTSTTLTGVDRSVLIAPKATDKTANSLRCAVLTTNGEDFYEYSGDGSNTCLTGSSCLSYTLRYKDESTNAIKTVASRRSATITSSGTPALSQGVASFVTVPLSWTAVANVVSYTIQLSSSCADFTGAVETVVNQTPTSMIYTGMTQGSNYCFRIAGNASNGQRTNWSNTVSGTTKSILTPSPAVGSITNSQMTVSWGAVTNAATYDLEQTTGSFTGTPSTSGIVPTSSTRTGLTIGVTYYFKVRAVATDSGDGTVIRSAWSGTVSGTPILPNPTSIAFNWTNDYGSSNQSATCSVGTAQYRRAITYRTDGSTADAYGAWTAWQTGTTFANDFIGEGMYGKMKLNVKCVAGSDESQVIEPASIEKRRPITSISAGTWYNQVTASARIGVGGGCVGGTTSMYKWGEIYHGSAKYHSGGGWGQWGDFELINSGWSSGDNLNTYRISRTICQTPYWERSLISAVAGSTLQNCCGDTALNNFNWFVYSSGYNYSWAR